MNFTNLIVQKLRTTMKSAFMVLVTIICVGSIADQSLNAQNLDPNVNVKNLVKLIDVRAGGIYSVWMRSDDFTTWTMTNGRGQNEGSYAYNSYTDNTLTMNEGVRIDLAQKKVYYPNGETGTIGFVEAGATHSTATRSTSRRGTKRRTRQKSRN